MSSTTVEQLMKEYFELKDRDRAIRKERNTWMESKRPGDFYSEVCLDPLVQQEGPCVLRFRGYSERVDSMCEYCVKRHGWYLERQKLAQRRSTIMRAVRRKVRR